MDAVKTVHVYLKKQETQDVHATIMKSRKVNKTWLKE